MPLTHDRFESIKKRYGHHASWAIWAEAGARPKDNVGDLSVFDLRRNPSLLSALKPDIVFVGLNISRPVETPLARFHDAKPSGMDFKIRYALKDSPYWGAYMTDIVKDFEQKGSSTVLGRLKADKEFEESNVVRFRAELKDLGSRNPEVVAFGTAVFAILQRHFARDRIRQIPHYSNHLSTENYRNLVKAGLGYT
jgi:hypothetical protein